MELSALDYAVIGFGLIGATVAGKAAAKMAANNGCDEYEQLGAACVVGGLSAAVLPAAAVGGLVVACKAGYDWAASDRGRLAVANAKAKTLGTMDRVVNGKAAKPAKTAKSRA